MTAHFATDICLHVVWPTLSAARSWLHGFLADAEQVRLAAARTSHRGAYMTTWVAMLRGINVLGKNKLPMGELAATLEDAGFESVRTYIQSGNVEFRSARGTARTLSARIEGAVLERFGFSPRVIVVTAAELAAAVRDNPFPEAQRNHKCLHLYLLSGNPATVDLGAPSRFGEGREAFLLKGAVLDLYTPGGFARSPLRSRIERGLGVAATARNWRTANELVKLAGRQRVPHRGA